MIAASDFCLLSYHWDDRVATLAFSPDTLGPMQARGSLVVGIGNTAQTISDLSQMRTQQSHIRTTRGSPKSTRHCCNGTCEIGLTGLLWELQGKRSGSSGAPCSVVLFRRCGCGQGASGRSSFIVCQLTLYGRREGYVGYTR